MTSKVPDDDAIDCTMGTWRLAISAER